MTDFLFPCIYDATMIITYHKQPFLGQDGPFHGLQAGSAEKELGVMCLILNIEIDTLRPHSKFLPDQLGFTRSCIIFVELQTFRWYEDGFDHVADR